MKWEGGRQSDNVEDRRGLESGPIAQCNTFQAREL